MTRVGLLSEHHFSEWLHFSKSRFSETQEKYYHVVFLQPKSLKKCRKKFENRFTSKIVMPKKYLGKAFCMCNGGTCNPNTLKLKMMQIFGEKIRVWRSVMHTIQFCFGLVHFK